MVCLLQVSIFLGYSCSIHLQLYVGSCTLSDIPTIQHDTIIFSLLFLYLNTPFVFYYNTHKEAIVQTNDNFKTRKNALYLNFLLHF